MDSLGIVAINKIMKWITYVGVIEIMGEKKIEKNQSICFVILFIADVLINCSVLLNNESKLYYTFYLCEMIGVYIVLTKMSVDSSKFYIISCCKIISEVLNFVAPVCTVLFISNIYENIHTYSEIVCTIIKIILLVILYLNMEYIVKSKLMYNKHVIISIFILVNIYVLLKNKITITSYRDVLVLKTIIICVIICAIIFTTLYLINKYKLHQETQRIKIENRYLAAELHKSKELLPALLSVAEDITNHRKLTDADIQVFLKEIIRLHKEDQQETEQSDMLLKNFCSTGLKLLDRQLLFFLQEAIDKGINFDIFVSKPINEEIDDLGLSQLQIQRTIGDLIRNAFRAIERSNATDMGQVLLVLGCKEEGILEIRVLDNGEHFPVEVLNSFGKRGTTTGGTGNGLADLVAYVDKVKASVKLEEFVVGRCSFVKGLSIVFDHKNVYELHTERRLTRGNLPWQVYTQKE